MRWKPVVGFEEYYLVSDEGMVWSIRRHRLLKPEIDRYGYEKVTLSVNGKCYYKTIHRLVAQAFVPNPHNKLTVNHINEDKTDNRAVNLEWLSMRDNLNHGSHNKRVALTKSKLPVIQIFPDGSTLTYLGTKDASRKTGINRCCISKCCKNIRKTAGGYRWRYLNEEY